MIDTSVVRVHQHGACIADNNHQDMGRSRGGLTSKIHAVVDTNGLRNVGVSRPDMTNSRPTIWPSSRRATGPYAGERGAVSPTLAMSRRNSSGVATGRVQVEPRQR